jgi:hypothetical protein
MSAVKINGMIVEATMDCKSRVTSQSVIYTYLHGLKPMAYFDDYRTQGKQHCLLYHIYFSCAPFDL